MSSDNNRVNKKYINQENLAKYFNKNARDLPILDEDLTKMQTPGKVIRRLDEYWGGGFDLLYDQPKKIETFYQELEDNILDLNELGELPSFVVLDDIIGGEGCE
ncbi:hypothetical protein GQR58_019763 [Nymphon striatum]|nr:hypothetical protein GQR58_019763 [Nymphon striatum]